MDLLVRDLVVCYLVICCLVLMCGFVRFLVLLFVLFCVS